LISRLLHIIFCKRSIRTSCFGIAMLYLMPFAVQGQITPAHQVKAAFIYNFTQFVQWPSHAYEGSRSPFVIGILGENPFGSYLEELVKDEKVNGRSIEIRKFKNAADVERCHILFINKGDAAAIARSFRGRGTLTVSDEDNFAKDGGMIRFFTANNKIRLQINPAAARAANIDISAKLLRLAEIVEQ
jgi:hypothetical protein